jgi:hypothetical protein
MPDEAIGKVAAPGFELPGLTDIKANSHALLNLFLLASLPCPEPSLSLFPVSIYECGAENKPKCMAMLRV